MDFFGSGIPVGRYFGITVRLHFTFLFFAADRVLRFGDIGFGLAFVIGLYLCILLHEFGHALMARWCDGEVDQIVLWPLGGLAFCRPAWHPTAHLLTSAAGPFVTLVLWGLFSGLTRLIGLVPATAGTGYVHWFCYVMARLNLMLLLFNLIPAFPMDGGRILRDTLWHFISATTATLIAVRLSQVIASLALAYAVYQRDVLLMLVCAFILLQAGVGRRVVGFEAGGSYEFSLKERLRRGSRRRQFFKAVNEAERTTTATSWHRCATCGKTENEHPTMDFRVCTECGGSQEYCPEHLDSHAHT